MDAGVLRAEEERAESYRYRDCEESLGRGEASSYGEKQ